MRIDLRQAGPVSVSVYFVLSQYIAEAPAFGRLLADCYGQPEKTAKFEMPDGDTMPYPRFVEKVRYFAPGRFAPVMGAGAHFQPCR